MDRKKYEDIEPYRGERFEKAKANLMARKEFIGAFAYMLSGDFSSVEPMVNEGSRYICESDDGWTIVTEDGKLAAHYENSIAITERGPIILTNE